MFKIRLTTPVTVLLATLGLPAIANAASPWHPAPNEAGYIYHADHFETGRSRADVQADIEVARKDGTLILYQRTAAIPIRSTTQPRTRAEVVAELKAETPAQRQARTNALLGL